MIGDIEILIPKDRAAAERLLRDAFGPTWPYWDVAKPLTPMIGYPRLLRRVGSMVFGTERR